MQIKITAITMPKRNTNKQSAPDSTTSVFPQYIPPRDIPSVLLLPTYRTNSYV